MTRFAVGGATSLADRKHRAGQRLWLGWGAVALTEDLRRVVREIRPAGFVLDAANVVEPEQLLELNRELMALADPHDPAVLAVAHIGGAEAPIGPPATVWPSARIVARSPEGADLLGRGIAQELRALGFSMNLAPWMEAGNAPEQFSDDPTALAESVNAFVAAHHAAHLAVCPRPVPVWGTDLGLQAALSAGCDALWADPCVVEESGGSVPATLSDRVLPRELRIDQRFTGLLIADGLHHDVVEADPDPVARVIRLTRATVDVLVLRGPPEDQLQVFAALVRAQERNPGMDRGSRDAVRRLGTWRERWFLGRPPRPPMSVVGGPDHRAVARRLQERAS